VATNGYPFAQAVPDRGLAESTGQPRHKYWLHALLLAATFASTTVVGSGLARAFREGRPFDVDSTISGYFYAWQDPASLLAGFPFSLTLLAILLAHEFGHYFMARYYGVHVTLPFFIPAPTPIGTMGAFIRIRSPILSKQVLFDIGIAGPLAGFVILLAPLVTGVALSKVIPKVAVSGDLVFGTPLVLRIFESIIWPGVAKADILLHPVAYAAWVGLLATALNLLPMGQLDGGHILYAFLGERTRLLTRIFVAALVPMGIFFAYSWLVWAAFMFFFGMRHPSIIDHRALGIKRVLLGVLALIVFVLSFTPSPIRTSDRLGENACGAGCQPARRSMIGAVAILTPISRGGSAIRPPVGNRPHIRHQ
jgi:Zn-dependent protease